MKPCIVVARQRFPDQLERLRDVAEVIYNQAASVFDAVAAMKHRGPR